MRAAGHNAGASLADFGAFQAEAKAFGHCRVANAALGAGLTSGDAVETRLNAGLKILLAMGGSFYVHADDRGCLPSPAHRNSPLPYAPRYGVKLRIQPPTGDRAS